MSKCRDCEGFSQHEERECIWCGSPRLSRTTDAVEYASLRMGLVQDTLDDMGPDAIDDGLSYQELWDGMGMMLAEWILKGHAPGPF